MQRRVAIPGSAAERLLRLWRDDGWPTLRLAAPVMVARAGIVFMFFVDSLMSGRGGATELAILGQGLAAQAVMMLVSVGLLQGSMVLIAQSFGAGEQGECGQFLKTAMALAAGLGLVFAGICLLVEPLLRATGLEDELAAGAGRVSLQFAWGMPGILLYIACGYFLESIKRPMVGMAIMLAVNALNIVADGIFVLGWFGWVEPMGAEGAVLTTSALRWVSFAAALAYILTMPDAAAFGVYAKLAGFASRLARILAFGAPIAIALGLQMGAMSSLAFMAGHLGAHAAAAYQLTFNFASVILMAGVGLAAATAVRVGHAVGALDQAGVRRSGLTGIALALLVMAVLGLGVSTFPEAISAAYVRDPAVWQISQATLTAAGLMIVLDGVMTVTMGALRGMGDVRWPAFLHGIAFWLVGVPSAYLLAFFAENGVVGLILGISLAMLVSLILLGRRFRLISTQAIRRA